MALDQQQVNRLLRAVANTRDVEISCDECLADMAEFAEAQLVGSEIPTALKRIETHIAYCPDCSEEYELLLEVIKTATERGT